MGIVLLSLSWTEDSGHKFLSFHPSSNQAGLKSTEHFYRQNQQRNYNQRHQARDLLSLHKGEHVWTKDMMQRDTVVSTAGPPRSYIIETAAGIYHRNRAHFSPILVASSTPDYSLGIPEVKDTSPVSAKTRDTSGVKDCHSQCPVLERRYPSRVRPGGTSRTLLADRRYLWA